MLDYVIVQTSRQYHRFMYRLDEGQKAFVLSICAIVLMTSVMALLLWAES